MSVHAGPYVGARICTGRVTNGSRGLMAWFLGAYGELGGTNLGIYNCRDVRGGTTTSLHGEGRAADLGVPIGAPWADTLADALVNHSAELGVQCVIYDRKIWSNAYPQLGRRPYTGRNPHREHLHVELTWDAAADLTAELVQQVLAAGLSVAVGPADLRVDGPAGREQVLVVQRRLLALGYPLPHYGADGNYGAETAAAVRMLQARAGLAVDGIVGRATRAALERGVRNIAPVPVRFIGYGFPFPAGHYLGPESQSPRCHSGARVVDRKHVRALTVALRRRGWVVDGSDRYTRKLQETVRDYQRDARLKVDGLAGERVWESIDRSPLR